MKKLFFVLFILLPFSLKSQELPFKNFTPFEGLSTLKTSCIIQGPDGYIWVGTENGLNRFDGVNFKIYTKDINDTNSLPGNVIMDLMTDNFGNLWIATDGGVCGYNSKQDIFFPVPDKTLATAYCKSIIKASQNNFWAITGGDIITLYDKNWKEIEAINNDPTDNDYIKNVSFYCLAEDKDGLLWIGTQEKGFYSYDLTSKKLTSYEEYINEKEIFQLFPDSYGNIWIGTHGTPNVFIKSENKIYPLNSPDCPYNLPPYSISHFFEDDKGFIWTCNWKNGITKYDIKTDRYTLYQHSDNNKYSFSKGSVEYTYQDKEGNFWFAGATTGLTVTYANIRKINKLSDMNFPAAGIFQSPATAITKDISGNFWFGSDGNGISIWNPRDGIIREYIHNPNDSTTLGGPSILAAFTDSKGRIWCGGYNSYLNLYDPENKSFKIFKPEGIPPYVISGSDIRAFVEDEDGLIWVATNGGGVNTYDLNTFEHKTYNVESGFAHNYCISLLNDNEGNIWVGSYGGLTIYNKKHDSVRVFTKDEKDPNALQSNWINSLFKDSKGRYWLGTQLGLSLFNPETGECENYFESDGLVNNSIMSIQEDEDGMLWIGTMGGLSKFDVENKKFHNFNISDGLPDNQFKMGAAFKGSDNFLYFGTNKGICYFNPSEITKNPVIPTVKFTGLLVNNELIVPGKSKILEYSIDHTSKLKLKKHQNFFRINFTAISYYQAEKNTYRYILEGVDKSWIDSKNNYVSYTNLRHGRYTLKVQAFNNDGIPSEIKEIKIIIKPKWYNTIVFWIIIIAGIIYLLYRYIEEREEQRRKNSEKIEQKIEENKQLLNEKIKELELKEEEINKKNLEELQIKYLHEGISKFSEIISQNRENVAELSTHLISELVEYIGANAGIIYVLDDSNEDKQLLKPTGFFCANIDNKEENYYNIGEGNIGTCFLKKEPLLLDNLPDGYFVLTSGLGDTNLRHAILAPILHEENCLGVIELASINKIESYKLEFIYKLSENFASALAITKANEQTKKMLRQNQLQAEELKSQEEEMRQNLEEMQATQEELQRQMESSEKAQIELSKEKALIDTLLKYSPEGIYFKDKESKFIKASQSMANDFKVKSVEELYGKSDFDFFTEEHARPAYEDEQEIIRTDKPIIDKIEKETYTDGTVRWVSTSKMPLYNEKGEIIGTFGITKDVTESYKLQESIKLQNEELQAQEEELRQNLEEMQSIQENLEEQVASNKKLQKEMTEGNALLNALMNNLPDFIYFKDNKSRFIRISRSMLPLFPVKSLEEMIGKSDFDFQPKEIAQKYYNNEMEIIKTGKGIEDEIAHEIMDNGVEQWVSTTKLPLYDEDKKCIGTFGISKNITKIKMQEKNYQVLIDKLRKQLKSLNQEIKSKEEEINKLKNK